MSEQDGKATIDKWSRKLQRAEDEDREANKSMKNTIAEAMRNENTHRNIARELLDARRGGAKPHDREGYGDDGEIITGFGEDRPWERD